METQQEYNQSQKLSETKQAPGRNNFVNEDDHNPTTHGGTFSSATAYKDHTPKKQD